MKKIRIALLGAAACLGILTAAADEAVPGSGLIYTYYYDYDDGIDSHVEKYVDFWMCNSRIINGKKYDLWCEVPHGEQPDWYDLKVTALLRCENNKVYMMLGQGRECGVLSDVYGFWDKEVMIYDFGVAEGDTYRIGSLEDYEAQDYSTADFPPDEMMWLSWFDQGMIKVVKEESRDFAGTTRKVWTMEQTLNEEIHKQIPDYPATRTFEVVEGIGAMSGLMAFPGMFTPNPQITFASNGRKPRNPKLYQVKTVTSGQVIYENKDLGIETASDSSDSNPMYYDLQGRKIAEPESGSLYIVKQGAKVSRRIYR